MSIFRVFPILCIVGFKGREKWISIYKIENVYRDGSRDFGKGGAPYVGHHGWLGKKVLGFRWPKGTKITLETISFW